MFPAKKTSTLQNDPQLDSPESQARDKPAEATLYPAMDWFCWENLHRKLYMVFTPSN
jgi:hypothetical protein